MDAKPLVLRFDAGTLVLEGAEAAARVPSAFRWDGRLLRWRAPASEYRSVVRELVRGGVEFEDAARGYQEFDFPTKLLVEPRPYQHEAIAEWRRHGGRGVVGLPTGGGERLVGQ